MYVWILLKAVAAIVCRPHNLLCSTNEKALKKEHREHSSQYSTGSCDLNIFNILIQNDFLLMWAVGAKMFFGCTLKELLLKYAH